MFATLYRIANDYQTTKQLRKNSEKDWECDYESALEMSYENIQEAAKQAVMGFNIKGIKCIMNVIND